MSYEKLCGSYDLHSLIKQSTFYKNPKNPRCTDLILTNLNPKKNVLQRQDYLQPRPQRIFSLGKRKKALEHFKHVRGHIFKNKLENTWAAILKTSTLNGQRLVCLVSKAKVRGKIKTYKQSAVRDIYGSPNVAILSELNMYSLGKIYGQCENLILIICKENIWTVKKKKCSRYYFSLMRSNVLFQQIKCAIQCLYPFCLL